MKGFDACWHRLERASVHRREAAEVWNEYIDRHPFETVLVSHGDGSYSMFIEQEEPVPHELPVLFGEWLYILRAALDYAVYETAVVASGKRPPPRSGDLQFPVCDSKDMFDRSRKNLRALAPHQLDLLEMMQPYQHDNPDTSALRWLNRFSREDRHRQLSVLTAYAAELSPIVAVPNGCTAELTFGARSLVNGSAEIFAFTVEPWHPDMKVEVNPRTGLDPDIESWAESPFWGRIPYNKRLSIVTSVPTTMVASLEYDCFGSGTRNADWLLSSFKDESDARRDSWRPMRYLNSREW